MALTSGQIDDVWCGWMKSWSDSHRESSLSKASLRNAVSNIDTWLDDNGSSFDAALPSEVSAVLSTKEKAELLMLIAHKRYEVL